MKNKVFTNYLQSKNISGSTIKSYTRILQRFLDFTQKEVLQITKKDILNYLQFLQEKQGLQNQTRRQILGVLKHYFSHLQQEYEIQNPARLIKIRGAKKKTLHTILSYEELQEFTDLYFYELEDKRNYLILTFCIFQGLNISEWKALKVGDIDILKGTIFIEKRRKSNARKLNLQPTQIAVLYPFLQNREAEDPLFTSTPDIQKWTKKLRKLYSKFENFKQTRASIITHWIKTAGLRKAQYLAGHRYISSTENYLANDFESLKNDLDHFHPLN